VNRAVIIAVLLLVLTGQAISAGTAYARRRAVRRGPVLKTEIRSDCAVGLSWRSYPDTLYLERRADGDDLFSIVVVLAPHQTRFTDSTLVPNSPAWYRLRPAAARYISEFGPEAGVTISLSAPPRPKLVRIAVDSVEVKMDTANVLAVRVLVERKIGGMYTVVGHMPRGSHAFSDGGVGTGSQFYRLRYEGVRYTSPPSPADSILMDISVPANVTLTYESDHAVIVSWLPTLPWACMYDIEKRSTEGIHVYRTDLGAQQWTDNSLRYAQRSYYRVRAVSGVDTSMYSPPVSAYYVLRPAMDLHTDPVHDPVVNLIWSDADSLTATYVVERSADSVHFDAIATLTGHEFTYADSLNTRGQRRYYRVRSVATNGVTAISDVVSEYIPRLNEGMVFIPDTSLGSSFYCDALETSAASFAEYCRATGRELPEDPAFPGHPDYWSPSNPLPAVNVSWNDAVAFCNWRSLSTGLQPAYDAFGRILPGGNGYRLMDRSHFTLVLHTAADTSANVQDTHSGHGEPTVPISTYGPHPLAYNLIGNVWEWVNDSIADGGRLILGGAYCTSRRFAGELPEFCYRADYMSPTIGFRCILPARLP
jgi:hypothetical protein